MDAFAPTALIAEDEPLLAQLRGLLETNAQQFWQIHRGTVVQTREIAACCTSVGFMPICSGRCEVYGFTASNP